MDFLKLHNESMGLISQAEIKEANGQFGEAKELYQKALSYAEQAFEEALEKDSFTAKILLKNVFFLYIKTKQWKNAVYLGWYLKDILPMPLDLAVKEALKELEKHKNLK